jgi:hypothetical protein
MPLFDYLSLSTITTPMLDLSRTREPIDEGNPIANQGVDMDDYSKIAGEKPMTLEEWKEQNKVGCK